MSISASYEKHFESVESQNTGVDTGTPFQHGSVRLPGAATNSSDVVAFGIIVLVAVWRLLAASGNTDVNSIGYFMSLLVFVRYLVLRALDQLLDRSS